MGRKNHRKKKRSTNKYAPQHSNQIMRTNVVGTITKVKPIKISKPEQIFAIADEIFGGRYYSPGDK